MDLDFGFGSGGGASDIDILFNAVSQGQANAKIPLNVNLTDGVNDITPTSVGLTGNDLDIVIVPPPTSGDYLVRFFDIDGTILKEQFLNAGQDATAPTNPTYDTTYLVFAEWNQPFTNVQNDIDVGAIYDTIDGKTYLFLRITDTTGFQPTLQLNKATTDLMTINWGDATTNTTTTNGNFTITKTAPYSAIGDYIVTIECAGLYATNSSTAYLLGNNLTYSSTLLILYMGVNMRFNNTALAGHRSLSVISINKNTSPTLSMLSSCISLIHVNFPPIGTSFDNVLNGANCLQTVSIPPNFTTFAAGFNNCRAVKKIIAIGSTTWTTNQALENCNSLQDLIIGNSITNMGGFGFVRFCTSLKNFKPPTSLTTIDNLEFDGCTALTELEFSSALTSIGNNSFASCTSILEYTFLTIIPPTLGVGSFSGINAACKIYVPDGSVASYKAATNWTVVANYIYPLSTKP